MLKTYVKVSSGSSLHLFTDCYMTDDLNDTEMIYAMGGFYYSAQYYGCIGIRTKKTAVSISASSAWTRFCHGGTIVNGEDLYYVLLRAYYR